MGDEQADHCVLQKAAEKFEIISGLKRALDLNCGRLIGAARGEWERRFAGKEPSDECVSVRIHTETPSVRGSAFLAKPKSSAATKARQFSLPHLIR